MSNYIFRRIGRKIIPIKVSAGFTPHKVIHETSAVMRKALQAKAAAKTSLAMKRQKAVAAVREVLGEGWGFKPFNDENLVGVGNSLRVKTPRPDADLVVKFGASREIDRRAKVKSLLQRDHLGPETFHVKTSKKSYLVQKRLSVVGKDDMFKSDTLKSARGWTVKKFWAKEDALRAKPRGMMIGDIGWNNVGLTKKGKMQILDSGTTTLGHRRPPFFSKSQRDYARKFRISFKKGKK